MVNTDEIRWKQRLDNFGKALFQLDDACNRDEYTDLERQGWCRYLNFLLGLLGTF